MRACNTQVVIDNSELFWTSDVGPVTDSCWEAGALTERDTLRLRNGLNAETSWLQLAGPGPHPLGPP